MNRNVFQRLLVAAFIPVLFASTVIAICTDPQPQPSPSQCMCGGNWLTCGSLYNSGGLMEPCTSGSSCSFSGISGNGNPNYIIYSCSGGCSNDCRDVCNPQHPSPVSPAKPNAVVTKNQINVTGFSYSGGQQESLCADVIWSPANSTGATSMQIGNKVSFVITGLSPSTTYHVFVRNYGARSLASGASCIYGWQCKYDGSMWNYTTQAGVVCDAGQPTISLQSVDSTSASLNWSYFPDIIRTDTGYLYSSGVCGSGTPTSYRLSSAYSLTLSSLLSSHQYCFRVVNSQVGCTDKSDDQVFSTQAACTTTAPAGLSSFPISSSSENLTWTPGNGGAIQYLYIDTSSAKVAGGCPANDCTFNSDIPAGQNSFSVAGLNPGTKYYWRVMNYANPTCNASSSSSFTTAACSITAPSGLTAASVNSSAENISWTPGTGGGIQYLYVDADQAKVAGGCPANDCTFNSDITSGVRNFPLAGLFGGSTYYWRVMNYESPACNASLSGSFITKVCDTGSPVFGTPTVGATSASINWTYSPNNNYSVTGYLYNASTCGSGTPVTYALGIAGSKALASLLPTRQYCFRVNDSQAGCPDRIADRQFTTSSVCDAGIPVFLPATYDDLSININWTYLSGAAYSQNVSLFIGACGSFLSQSALLDSSAAAWQFGGLAANSAYCARINNSKAGCSPAISDHNYQTCDEGQVSVTAPNFGPNSANISWSIVSGAAYPQTVVLYNGDCFVNGVQSSNVFASAVIGSLARSYVFTGLTPAAKYCALVYNNGTGCMPEAGAVTFTMPCNAGSPVFLLPSIGQTSIVLNWTYSSGYSYSQNISLFAGGLCGSGVMQYFADGSGVVRTRQFSGLLQNSLYCARINNSQPGCAPSVSEATYRISSACTASCDFASANGICKQGSPLACKPNNAKADPSPNVTFTVSYSNCQAGVIVDASENTFIGDSNPFGTWMRAAVFTSTTGYSDTDQAGASQDWIMCNAGSCFGEDGSFTAGQNMYWRIRDGLDNRPIANCSVPLVFPAPASTPAPTAFSGLSNLVLDVPLGTRSNQTNISITTFVNGVLLCPNVPSTVPYLSVISSFAGSASLASKISCSNGVSIYSINTTNPGIYVVNAYFDGGAGAGNFTRQVSMERFSDDRHAAVAPDFWAGLVPLVAFAAIYLRKGNAR